MNGTGTGTLSTVSEKLSRRVAYAELQWLQSILTRRVAVDAVSGAIDEEQKLKESYETIKAQAAEIEAAVQSIKADAAQADEGAATEAGDSGVKSEAEPHL
jgi:hypothetical protein